MSSVFFNKGENCIAAGRLFVEDSIHDQFVQKVVSSRLESEPEGQAVREAVVQSKEGLGSSRWVPPTRGSLENSLESSAQTDITKGPVGRGYLALALAQALVPFSEPPKRSIL